MKRPKISRLLKGWIPMAVLALCLGAGGTVAWLQDETPALVNHLDVGEVTCAVREEYNGSTGVKQNVRVENTGTVDAYLRVALVYNQLEEQQVVAGRTIPQDALKLDGWICGTDGFYYWTAPVAPGGRTGALISSMTLGVGEELQVIAAAIQARPEAAVESAWPAVTVSDGHLAARGQ